MKLFRGRRHTLNTGVTITMNGGKLQIPSDYPNLGSIHTNDLNFGYSGQGPRELAIAILAHVTGDYELTQQLYKNFADDVTSKLPDSWELSSDEVLSWLSDCEYEVEFDPMETNIVKATAKRLGMTYKELGEAIGYGEDTIKQAARKAGKVSAAMQKAIELLNEITDLKKEKERMLQLKTLLRDFIE